LNFIIQFFYNFLLKRMQQVSLRPARPVFFSTAHANLLIRPARPAHLLIQRGGQGELRDSHGSFACGKASKKAGRARSIRIALKKFKYK
jgi:hypothetical protein